MTIRPLTTEDAVAYQALRLKALKTNPKSYLAVFETEQAKPTEFFAWEIRYATSPPISGYYGIFLKNQLIGYTQLNQVQFPKQRHIAYFFNLYIDPDHRNQGYATTLFNHLAKLAKEKAKIEQIFITCNAKNSLAQKLYKKLGFCQYGIKRKSVKWQNEYDDEIEMVKNL